MQHHPGQFVDTLDEIHAHILELSHYIREAAKLIRGYAHPAPEPNAIQTIERIDLDRQINGGSQYEIDILEIEDITEDDQVDP